MVKAKFNKINIPIKKAIFESSPSYSADVHFGEARTDGTMKPERPWIDTAVSETNLESEFATQYKTTGDISQAFVKTAEKLHENIKANLLDERWQWDRVTIRSDGQRVRSPRDAFDTGFLHDNQYLEFFP